MSELAPHAPQVDPEHPWPGLVAFSEETRHYFFGREREEDELLRRIRREVATLLFGQSGLGKTSLLQAGLTAHLREQGLVPVPVRLGYGDGAASPLEQLRSQFSEALANAAPGAPRLGEDETLWEYLHRRDSVAFADQDEPPLPVFLIDQFEEAFTLGLSKARTETQFFLTELTDLIENRCPTLVRARLERDIGLIERFSFERSDYRIVLAIREDYLPHLEALRTRAPSLGRNRFRLTRMDGSQALDAIVRPGAGLIEPTVAEAIVRYIARARPDDPFGSVAAGEEPPLADLEVDPPLLSLFCNELNARRIKAHKDQITAEILDVNKDRILRDFYESSFQGLPARLRIFVEDELVTESGLRTSLALEQAYKRLGRWSQRRRALDQLIRRRLLHVEDRSDVPRIELIHDLLTAVVVESRNRRRRRRPRLFLAAGIAIVLATIASSIAYSWWLDRQYRQDQTLVQRASACATSSPDAPICAALENVDERSFGRLSEADANTLLLGFLQVAHSRFARGDVPRSLALLRKADTLIDGRQGYELIHAGVFDDMGDRERRHGEIALSLQHTRQARALYLSQLRQAQMARDQGLADQITPELVSVDLRLALLDRTNRASLLREALNYATQVVQQTDLARRDALDPNAARQFAIALGNRSFAYVLSGDWRAALTDIRWVERISELDRHGELAWILTNKGDALLLEGQTDDAIRVFESIAGERGQPPNSLLCGDILEDMIWLWEMQPGVQDGIRQVRAAQLCNPRRDAGQ